MAEKVANLGSRSAAEVDAERRAKSKATRAANKKNEVSLNEAGRSVLSIVRNARQASSVLADRVQQGKVVSPEAVKACSVLIGEVAGLTVQG